MHCDVIYNQEWHLKYEPLLFTFEGEKDQFNTCNPFKVLRKSNMITWDWSNSNFFSYYTLHGLGSSFEKK